MCALDDQKSKASCGPIMTTLARDVVISMSAHSLPVISCDGCGACCAKQGTPPMLPDEYAALPKRLKWNIKKHALRYDYSLPCLWYDEKLKRCSNYEYRGIVCREFEVGGVDCLSMREGLC